MEQLQAPPSLALGQAEGWEEPGKSPAILSRSGTSSDGVGECGHAQRPLPISPVLESSVFLAPLNGQVQPGLAPMSPAPALPAARATSHCSPLQPEEALAPCRGDGPRAQPRRDAETQEAPCTKLWGEGLLHERQVQLLSSAASCSPPASPAPAPRHRRGAREQRSHPPQTCQHACRRVGRRWAQKSPAPLSCRGTRCSACSP